MPHPRRLLVFLKVPRLGRVKTRLAASIGEEAALQAYRGMVAATLGAAGSWREVELRFAPDDGLGEVEPLLRPGWSAVGQGEGNLGSRLERAFNDAFREGTQRVLVIGSDCPSMQASDLLDAEEALSSADVVLGPASDGGYWLLGLRRPAPYLFRDMPWSTDTVFAETRRRVEAAGLRLVTLRTLSDVDTEADWQAWVTERKDG